MKIKIKCLQCGKEKETSTYHIKKGQGKFCSKKCFNEYRCGEHHPAWKPRIITHCPECKKELAVAPYKLRYQHKFCNIECHKKYKEKQKIKTICSCCGIEIKLPISHLNRGKIKFCSLDCKYKYYSGENHHWWKGVVRKCKQCGVEFHTMPSVLKQNKGKFCSLYCYRKYRSINIRGKNHPRWSKVPVVCRQCGKKFETYPYVLRNGFGMFCSAQCKGAWMSLHIVGENHPGYLPDKERQYCWKWNDEFRTRARSYYKYIGKYYCANCGKTEEENGRQLTVHHVYYKKVACCEEDIPKYFVMLCTSCHAKTNFNREYWKNLFEIMVKEEFGSRCYIPQYSQVTRYGIL